LGSDLMGSIRVPAHFCGVVGLKPTTGRVPCAGHTPQVIGPLALGAVIGPLARRVEDLSLLLKALSGFNAVEPASVPALGALGAAVALKGCRVAWYGFDGVTPVRAEILEAVQRAARVLEEAGLVVEERRPPSVEAGPGLWSKLFAWAAFDRLREVYAGQEQLAGEDARFLLKTFTDALPPTASAFIAAWNERDLRRGELIEWMKDVPLIIAPVGSVAAFAHGSRKVSIGDETLSVFRAFGYSQTYNVYGLPVVCVPAGRTPEGLPVGVQVIGRPFAEETVLAAASIIEQAQSNL
jgi:amidase